MFLKVIILLLLLFYMLCLRRIYHTEGTIGYNRARRNYAIFAAVLLILQSGLRDVSVGSDTYRYMVTFDEYVKWSWPQVGRNFFEVYQLGEGKDAGYQFVVKLFSLFSIDFQFYLLFVAALFFSSLMIIIYDNTKRFEDIWLAVLLYFAIFYVFFSVTGIRQTIATSFCLFAYRFVVRRKLLPFVLCVCCAAFVHKTALVFLPYYWISNYKNVKVVFVCSVCLFPVMTLIGYQFTTQLAIWSGSENYIGYADEGSRGAINLILLYFLISFVVFEKYREDLDFLIKNRFIFNAISIGLVLFPLSFNSPNLVRLVQYYSIFLLVFMGYVGMSKPNYPKLLTMSCLIGALLYKIVQTPDEYAFYWEHFVPKTSVF